MIKAFVIISGRATHSRFHQFSGTVLEFEFEFEWKLWFVISQDCIFRWLAVCIK